MSVSMPGNRPKRARFFQPGGCSQRWTKAAAPETIEPSDVMTWKRCIRASLLCPGGATNFGLETSSQQISPSGSPFLYWLISRLQIGQEPSYKTVVGTGGACIVKRSLNFGLQTCLHAHALFFLARYFRHKVCRILIFFLKIAQVSQVY